MTVRFGAWCQRVQRPLQGNKPMVEKIIVRALKSLSDNQVVINRDVWLKVGGAALSCPPRHKFYQ